MKHETFLRVAFAAALLFGANIGAQAQFGGLKGLANKAKKAVKEKVEGNQQTTEGANANSVSPSASESTSPSTQSQTSSNVQQDAMARYRASHPDQAEAYNAEQAGGMDKYLGLDQTENGRILWKYADMSPNESQKSSNLGNAKMAARHIVEVLRYLKGNTERFSQYDNQTHTLDVLNNTVGEEIKGMAAKGAGKSPLPQADINALKAECARVKQLYLEAKGGKEKSASEVKTEADSKYIQDIAKQNYLLNDLTDKNRNAKAVADYKAKINAKVKSQLAPTKILGTYSTSFAWQGLYLPNFPELNEQYSSVQEMQFKTFYEKGGKYYVVKGAFRQSIKKGDVKNGAQPDNSYWPGLETPVEIPADKIQGKF